MYRARILARARNGITRTAPDSLTCGPCLVRAFNLTSTIYANVSKQYGSKPQTQSYLVKTAWNASGKRILIKQQGLINPIPNTLDGNLRMTEQALDITYPFFICPTVQLNLSTVACRLHLDLVVAHKMRRVATKTLKELPEVLLIHFCKLPIRQWCACCSVRAREYYCNE